MSWGKSLWVPTIAGIQLFQQPSAKWVRCITLVSSHGCQAKTHGTVQPVGQFFLWNSRHLLAVLLFLAAWMRSSIGPSAMQNQPCICRPWWAWWPKPTRMPERRMVWALDRVVPWVTISRSSSRLTFPRVNTTTWPSDFAVQSFGSSNMTALNASSSIKGTILAKESIELCVEFLEKHPWLCNNEFSYVQPALLSQNSSGWYYATATVQYQVTIDSRYICLHSLALSGVRTFEPFENFLSHQISCKV